MPCPICGELASWPIAHRYDPQIERWRSEIGDNRPYDWRLCRHCSNAFPSVQPDLQVLQRVWLTSRAAACADADDKEQVWRDRIRIGHVWGERSYRLLSRLTPRVGRFLDIACGLGETVRIFADHGWDAEGIDADPSMAPFHQKLGIASRISQFELSDDLKETYDLIQIAHAIYFMTNPIDFIGAVRNHLASDGLFCVVISDFMSSVAVDPPSYIHTFIPTTRASMRYALAVAGFETVLTQKISGSVYFVARPTANPQKIGGYPRITRLAYRTKNVRYMLIGKPYLALRAIAKRCHGIFSGTR
jgi:SAM-dependent methyltransferase